MFGGPSLRMIVHARVCQWVLGNVVYADETPKEKKMIKRTDLPIYQEQKRCATCIMREQHEINQLERTIGCARQELTSLYNETAIAKKQIYDAQSAILDKAEEIAEMVWAEGNDDLKTMAISTSGVLGAYCGYCRSWKARLMQGLIGATAVASILYPREFINMAIEKMNLINDIIGEYYPNEEVVEEESDD